MSLRLLAEELCRSNIGGDNGPFARAAKWIHYASGGIVSLLDRRQATLSPVRDNGLSLIGDALV